MKLSIVSIVLIAVSFGLSGCSAYRPFLKACDRGEMKGCSSLGGMYEDGRGGLEKDEKKAAELYRKACEGGEMMGCFNLGAIYKKGLGVSKDEQEAVRLFRKACDGGAMEGCYNLGIMYEHGQGVAKDDQEAAGLYRKACDGGTMGACLSLSEMYQDGRGVAKDLQEEERLFKKVAGGVNGVWVDSQSKLMWQNPPKDGRMEWKPAIEYCEGLTLGGHTDWRLPDKDELQTILAKSKDSNGCYWEEGLKGPCYGYWTSSSLAVKTFLGGDAWCVSFQGGSGYTGGVIGSFSDQNLNVRCVRSQESEVKAEKVVSDVVEKEFTDPTTKLIWQNPSAEKRMEWKHARRYCEGLKLAGYSDWRLPNKDELLTILTESKGADGCYWKEGLKGSCSFYWTSSTGFSFANIAWYVYFYNGGVHRGTQDFPGNVRCVRDGQ